MAMTDLLTRLREADGPSLVLDGEVWCHVRGYTFFQWDGAGCVYRETPNGGIHHVSARDVRPYTASIDAALSLVPAGMRWSCGFSKHVPHNAQVWTGTGYYEGECDSNRAIALVIAALEARAALTPTPARDA
jgi:hypothetical protein